MIKKLHLTDDPEFAKGNWFDAVSGVTSSLFDSGDVDPQFALHRRALRAVESRLDVKRVALTYVIQISFRSEYPDLSAKIANAVANSYINDQLEAKYQAAHQASVWLQDRIAELRDQASAAEQAVVAFRSKNNLVDAGGRLISDQQLAELNSQLVIARAQVSETRAKLERIQSILSGDRGNAVVSPTVADTLKNDVVTKQRIQYFELAAREADWSRRYGRNHLAVVNVRNQMAEIRKSIVEELRRVAETYKSDFEIAEQMEEGLQRQLAVIVGRAQDASQAQIALRDLESSAHSYRALHDNFIQRYMEAVQHQSFPSIEARLISPASRPLKKSHPKTLLSLVAGALGGGLLGLGVAAFREASDRVFRSGREIEKALATKCVAVVPKMSADDVPSSPATYRPRVDFGPRWIKNAVGVPAAVIAAPRSRFAEAIQAIKLATDQDRSARPSKVVGITSVLPGEGKSTIAASLARLVAQTGARTILVDCDLRNSGLTSIFAPDATAGILEAAAGAAALEEAMWRDELTRMTFLPAVVDSAAVHPNEFFASQETKKLFDSLRQNYDWVLVDLPPLVPIVDVRATTHLIDAYLLVIEWGASRFDVVTNALMSATGVHDRLLGAVLNKADIDKLSSYQGKYGL